LLTIPNELLLEIASSLRLPDLRRLSRVNCQLYFFTNDYLARYRYNSGLVALPNEIILEIVQHLGRQKDRSNLARASQRFYPLIMHYIVRHDVRHGGSSLLNYAAKKNLGGMARNILHIGGDVNTQRGCRVGFAKRQPTPLVTAASHGHKKMVRILLKTGASHFVDGMRVPLAVAISNRHENVALILSQELDFGDMFLTKTGQMVFQMGCEMKLVNLVCHYLERGSHCAESVNAPRLHPRSTALYRTLLKDASKDILLKRELHANAYQIVLMLLQHGASPDIRIGATR
ncbi:hypothetical protein BU16DRAFT_422296, partial [Lophium mytilinum]